VLYRIGLLYSHGQGVSRDANKAQNYFQEVRQAAERGDSQAQDSLGRMYDQGEGVPQNDTEARRWYESAAHQGYEESQFMLASFYRQGRGGPADPILAYYWNSRASELGHYKAIGARNELRNSLTAEQLTKANRLLKG
jgi:TPR repeat protein